MAVRFAEKSRGMPRCNMVLLRACAIATTPHHRTQPCTFARGPAQSHFRSTIVLPKVAETARHVLYRNETFVWRCRRSEEEAAHGTKPGLNEGGI